MVFKEKFHINTIYKISFIVIVRTSYFRIIVNFIIC